MKLLAALLLVACGGTSPAPAPVVANSAPEPPEPLVVAPVTAPVEPATAAADDSETLDRNSGIVMAESVAGVTIGMTGAELTKILGKPRKKSGPAYEGEATGMYFVTWSWPGLDINLNGDTKAGPFKTSMIIVSSPTHRTQRGIGVGSTLAEVEKAYAGLRDPSSQDWWVAGSIYGGLHLQIKDGKVSELFLGAGSF